MNPNKEEEIAFLNNTISLLQEEVFAKNELIKIQKAQIKKLEEYNSKIVTMMNEFFDSLK